MLDTPELVSSLSRVDSRDDDDPHVFLRSDAYYQLGVDLCQIATLEAALTAILDVPNCSFIFVAEVSITYMETRAADSLIEWASTLGQGKLKPSWRFPSPSQLQLALWKEKLQGPRTSARVSMRSPNSVARLLAVSSGTATIPLMTKVWSKSLFTACESTLGIVVYFPGAWDPVGFTDYTELPYFALGLGPRVLPLQAV